MQKTEWKFTYKAADLVVGAKAKKASMEAKFDWWEKKKEELMKNVANSLQVTDSLASTYTNAKVGYGPQVTLDVKLQQQLSEAHQRLVQLDTSIREYDGWIQVLEANATQSLELNHTDWLYFFGAESKSRIKDPEDE